MFDNSIIKQIDKGGFNSVLGEFCRDENGNINFNEVHAIGYGFLVSINLRKPKFSINDIPDDYPEEIKKMLFEEHHYYTVGRTVGDCLKVIIGAILAYYGFTILL